jgi:hypothetical protein
MTLKACILAEQAVLRYTSYPTAPHFSAEIGPEIHAGWLHALGRDATLSLYLHVPYCAKLCLYCGCHTKIVQRRDPVESYADALAQEIARVAALTGRHKITSRDRGRTPRDRKGQILLNGRQLARAHHRAADVRLCGRSRRFCGKSGLCRRLRGSGATR